MNKKGFTLIELLVTIILIAVLTTITTVSIINILKTSKEKSYEVLVKNIKIATQNLYEECENSDIIESELSNSICKNLITDRNCPSQSNNCANITIKNLVAYGFLKTSATDNSGNKLIENPLTNENMNSCEIEILKYIDATDNSITYKFESNSTDTFCPSNEDLK